jgi:hypothetical protein
MLSFARHWPMEGKYYASLMNGLAHIEANIILAFSRD